MLIVSDVTESRPTAALAETVIPMDAMERDHSLRAE